MSTTRALREQVAAELRAEMARQKRTGVELAQVIGRSQQVASDRMLGKTAVDLDELPLIADWLGIELTQLLGLTPARPTAVSA